MNTKQRNYYEHVIVNQMNRFASYMNYLSDFGKEYNKAIDDLCKENNCNIEDVNISQELIDFKKQIESSYDKAKSFYKDLEYIRNQNRSLMDIDYLIRSFNTRVNLAKFPIPKNITLQFINNTVIKKGYVAKTDYSEELKKLEKYAIELGIDIDKLKSEINNAFLEAQKTNKEKLIEKINEFEKDVDQNYINKLYEVLEVQEDITKKVLNFANEKLEELDNKLKKEILGILSNIDNDSMAEIEYILDNLKNKYDKFKQYLDEYKGLNLFLASMKALTDGLVYANRQYEDAAGLWVLESSNFTRGLDYLHKNGRLIEHISDLNNPELEKIVREKCATQNFNTDDPKGIIFHKDSSLAKSIVQSNEFKENIIENYKKLLINNEIINKTSIVIHLNFFNEIDLDTSINNFLALHLCDIINLYIKDNIIHAIILDTGDYNDWKVFAPKALQDAGIIKNDYFIIEIEVPLNQIFHNDEENLI